MVNIICRYRPQEGCLYGPGLLEVLRLDQKIILLSGLNITVTGQLLDHVDGELAGPVGNTRSSHIMESMFPYARLTAYGLESPQEIINQVLRSPPAAFFHLAKIVIPAGLLHKHIGTTLRGHRLPGGKQVDCLGGQGDQTHLVVFWCPGLNKAGGFFTADMEPASEKIDIRPGKISCLPQSNASGIECYQKGPPECIARRAIDTGKDLRPDYFLTGIGCYTFTSLIYKTTVWLLHVRGC